MGSVRAMRAMRPVGPMSTVGPVRAMGPVGAMRAMGSVCSEYRHEKSPPSCAQAAPEFRCGKGFRKPDLGFDAEFTAIAHGIATA